MAAPTIQFKRGASSGITSFKAGEPAFTTDTFDFYIGLDNTLGNNKFFGSHRYWTRENGSAGLSLNLVDKDGTNKISVKSPNTLAGDTTYTLPATPTNGYFLKTNASGDLSWAEVVSTLSLAADTGTADNVSTGQTITFSGGEGIDTAVTDNTITVSAELATDTNKGVASFDATDFTVSTGAVTVNVERIQDIAGAMFSSNTETLITATYQDDDGTIDLAVDNDLANYDNTNSAFITASSSDTLTNKTFDANGTGNSLSNVEVADFAASAIVTEGEGISSNDNDSTLPTSAAVKDYADTAISNIDLTVSTAGDSGTGSVSTSQTLTVSGTANEIETAASGQSITIGLPNDVTIGNNLTVTGNLYVNGSTTQVNTAALTVEDRTIELGIVDGSAPSSTTTWDLGVLFNYYDGSAKKSALVWEQGDARFKLGSVVSDGGGTGTSNPQITFTTYAPIEVSELWVNNTCTGGSSQVIACSGSDLVLQNIVIDGGEF